MRNLVAGLIAAGMIWGLTTDARADAIQTGARVGSFVIQTDYVSSPSHNPTIQLARHCGPPRGYYRGGWGHHHARPYGSYYRAPMVANHITRRRPTPCRTVGPTVAQALGSISASNLMTFPAPTAETRIPGELRRRGPIVPRRRPWDVAHVAPQDSRLINSIRWLLPSVRTGVSVLPVPLQSGAESL